MHVFIYLFLHISIYNKGGKTHWRLAGRCPLGVSICLSVAGTGTAQACLLHTELTSKHTQNQFKKKVKKNNKGGKTHWRLAGRCPFGVSICLSVRRHWNCVSVSSGHVKIGSAHVS